MEILAILIIVIVFFSMSVSMFSFAPWIGSPRQHLQRILELAKIKSGERFYDLGCGDGRVVIHAAKHFGAKATGIELGLPQYFSSTVRCFLSGATQANIVFGNLFNRDLSDADVIYLYGTPQTLEKRLRKKLEGECKRGTRIVSFMFEISGWEPAAIVSLPGRVHEKDMVAILYVLESSSSS